MTDVDRRVVELEFDNAKFEKNARSTIKALDDLDAALELKDATKGLTELERVGRNFSLQNVSDNVERISDSFTLLGRVVLKIKDTIAESLTNSLLQMKRYADEYIGLLSTMSQASAGFSKYQKKTLAVQSIKSALPDTDMETITKALDDLNKYTDETSYDFTEMVATIGKFTANGVKLEDAVEAMKGIGNEAAKSGASIQEANRAMYNFAQALGFGSVKLMDWRSIENANMATKEFKEQIIETAVELGVLKKQGDKVLTKKGTVVDYSKFSYTLNEGWFTNEVLVKVLNKYADVTTKFGLDAFHAAQQAKTFQEAIDAVKDSASTGWMKTYELIFGNLNEAIELFTGLANRLIEITTIVGDWRNGLLEGWRELGGREDLIQGLTDVFEGLWNIVRIVGDGIHEVFPETTAESLKSFTDGIRDFGKTFRETFGISEKILENKITVFNGELATFADSESGLLAEMIKNNKGLSSNFEELRSNLREGIRGEDVSKLQERLKSLGYDLGDAGVDGIFGPKTKAALEAFQKDYGLAVDGIYGKLSHSKLMELISNGGVFGKLVSEDDVRKATEYSDVMERLRKVIGGAASIVRFFGKVISFAGKAILKIGDALSPIADVLLTVLASFGEYLIGIDSLFEKNGYFSTALDNLSNFLAPIKGWLKTAGNSFLHFFGFVKDEKDANKETFTFSKLLGDIKSKMEESGVFDRFASAIEKISSAFSNAKEKLSEYFESFKTYLTEHFLTRENDDGTTDLISYVDILSSIGEFFANSFAWVLETIAGVIDKLPENVEKVRTFLSELFANINISETALNTWERVKNFFKDIWVSIREFFTTSDTEGYSTVLSLFTNGLNHGDKLNMEENFGILAWLSDAWSKAVASFKDTAVEIAEFDKKYNVLERLTNFLFAVGFLRGSSGSVGIANALKGFTGIFSSLSEGMLTAGTKFLSSLSSNITLAVQSLSEIGNSFIKYKLTEATAEKYKQFAKVMLSFAAVIAVMAAAVYAFGNMYSQNPAALDRGLQVLIGLSGALIAFAIVAGLVAKIDRARGIKNIGSALLKMAAAVLMLTISVKSLAKLDLPTFYGGFYKLILLVGTLAAFNILTTKFGGGQVKGLLSLAVALYLITSIVKKLSRIDFPQFWSGYYKLLMLMASVAAFNIAISKFGGGQIKGLLSLAISLRVLISVVQILGQMDIVTAIKGFVGLVAMMAILGKFLKTVNSFGSNVKVSGLIGMSIALLLITQVVDLLGGIELGKLAKGLTSFAVVTKSMTKLIGNASKMNAKQGIQSLIAMVGMAGFMVIFAQMLKSVDTVPTDKIAAFAGGISAMFLSMGGFIKMTGSIGFKGIAVSMLSIVGIAVAIGAVIAAFAGLSKIQGFQEFMNSGAESIGKIIGSFLGSIKAAEVQAFNNGLKSFNSLETPNKDAIKDAIAAAQLLVDFRNTLPDSGLVQQIVDWIGNSKIEQLGEDMTAFAAGFNDFAIAMQIFLVGKGISLEELRTSTEMALEVAGLIADFSSGLKTPTWEEVLSTWINGSALELLSGGMEKFAFGFNGYCQAMVHLDSGYYDDQNDIMDRTDFAIAIAKKISVFGESIGTPTWEEVLSTWINGSALSILTDDMEKFAYGFNGYCQAMVHLDSEYYTDQNNIMGRTDFAIAIAKKISVFGDSLGSPTWTDVFGTWLSGSALSILTNDMEHFAYGFNGYCQAMVHLDSGYYTDQNNIMDRTDFAIKIAKKISVFGESIGTPTWTEVFSTWLNGSALSILTDDMERFAFGFNGYCQAMVHLDSGYYTDQNDISGRTDFAISIAKKVSEFAEGIGSPTFGETLGTWLNGSELSLLSNDMERFATGFNGFCTAMMDIGPNYNSEEIAEKTGTAIAITGLIKGFFEEMEKYPIDYKALSGYETAPAQISTDMAAFGEAIFSVIMGIDGLSSKEEIDADVQKAFDVTNSINAFFKGISEQMPTGEGLKEYNETINSMFSNVSEFGENIKALSTNLGGVWKSGILGNTFAGIAASEALLAFFEQVAASGDKIDITKPGWQVFFTGETVTNSFFDQANRFGDAVKKLATEHLGGIDSAKLVTDAENAKTALTTMAEFMTFVSSDFRIKTWIDEIPTNDTSRIEKFADQLDSLMFKTSDFAAWTNSIDEGHATAIANVMRTMAETMNYISGMTMNGTEVTLFADAIGVLGQSLPEFETVGYNITVAILNGMTVGNGDLIAQAAIALKNAIIEALAFTDEELANILTITPVVDTTAMETSLRSMQNRKLNVGTVASRANGSIGAAEATRNSQPGVINNDVTNTATVTVTGNTFKVNNERDINALANKIAALVSQQQRSFGSPPKLA